MHQLCSPIEIRAYFKSSTSTIFFVVVFILKSTTQKWIDKLNLFNLINRDVEILQIPNPKKFSLNWFFKFENNNKLLYFSQFDMSWIYFASCPPRGRHLVTREWLLRNPLSSTIRFRESGSGIAPSRFLCTTIHSIFKQNLLFSNSTKENQ